MKFLQARGLFPRLGLAAAVCLGLAGAASAANDLTPAGQTVSNTFVLDYSVDGVDQPDITNEQSPADPTAITQGSPTLFTVDRKVDLVVTANNSILKTPPGADAVLTFTVLNEGNDRAAYSFSIQDLDSGAASFDASSVVIRYLIDANDNGTIDATDGAYTVIAETPISTPAGSANYTADVDKGVRVFVEVQGTVDALVTDDSTDEITLVAEVRNPTIFLNESTSVGAVTVASVGTNNVIGDAQNVLADGTGVAAAEGAGDGLFAATGIIEVESPDLTAEKTVTVIKEPGLSGPVTDCGTATAEAEAKAIPGACVEYVITVRNTGDTAAADNLMIDDILPAEVTFVSAVLETPGGPGFIDGAVTGTGPILTFPTTALDSDCDGTISTCIIQLSDALLAAGETGEIVIRALIK